MEITTLQLTRQVDHLLDGLETDDKEIKEMITSLRTRTRALIFLCEQGHEVAAQVGLKNLSPEIDELIRTIGTRDTVPPESA